MREFNHLHRSERGGLQIEHAVRFKSFPQQPVFLYRKFVSRGQRNFELVTIINSQFTPIRCELPKQCAPPTRLPAPGRAPPP